MVCNVYEENNFILNKICLGGMFFFSFCFIGYSLGVNVFFGSVVELLVLERLMGRNLELCLFRCYFGFRFLFFVFFVWV